LLERYTKFIAKVENQKLRSAAKAKAELLKCINNPKDIPARATIKQEYVTCGKPDCSHRHGPYYYAYWKGKSRRLKKKYIGKYSPKAKPINDNEN